MKKNDSVRYVVFILLIISITISVFAFNFSNLSFIDSTPENWVEFVNYFGGIINPILAIINIWFFIKLTIVIQKANERANQNKSWVEKSEKLTFNFIDSLSELAAEIMFAAKNGNPTTENTLNLKITEKNELIFKNHFHLRIFIESELFKNCETREEFNNGCYKIIDSMNNFLKLLNGYSEMNQIEKGYRDFEIELKKMIKIGKKFSDEIYKI